MHPVRDQLDRDLVVIGRGADNAGRACDRGGIASIQVE